MLYLQYTVYSIQYSTVKNDAEMTVMYLRLVLENLYWLEISISAYCYGIAGTGSCSPGRFNKAEEMSIISVFVSVMKNLQSLFGTGFGADVIDVWIRAGGGWVFVMSSVKWTGLRFVSLRTPSAHL